MKKQLALLCMFLVTVIIGEKTFKYISAKKNAPVKIARILPKDTMRVNPEIAVRIAATEGFTLMDYIKHPEFLPVFNSKNEEPIGFNKYYSREEYEQAMAFINSIPCDSESLSKSNGELPKNLFDNGKNEEPIGFNKYYSRKEYEQAMAFINSIPCDSESLSKSNGELPKNLFDNGKGEKNPRRYDNRANVK
jgi:pterin-4a-carbinolamine dehydratase